MNEPYAFACNMKALSPSERVQHHQLLRNVVNSIRERIELRNGYRFVLDSAVPAGDFGAWMALETRCCPFLRLGLEIGASASGNLTLTGPSGVKEFILAELGIPSD